MPVFGGEFTVTVYPVPTMHETTAYADGSVAGDYDALAAEAKRGDGEAAVQLGYALDRCRGAATSEDALEERLGVMLRTGEVGPPWLPEPTRVDNLTFYIDRERQRFELCEGLTEEQIGRAYDWYALAAELGNYGAQSAAMQMALDHYSQTHHLTRSDAPGVSGIARDLEKFAAGDPQAFRTAARNMLAARAQGSLNALRDLAAVYAANALRPGNDYPSAANAYANLLAVAEVWHVAMNPGSYRFEDDLARFSRGLSAEEIAWAEAEARDILQQANCCRFW